MEQLDPPESEEECRSDQVKHKRYCCRNGRSTVQSEFNLIVNHQTLPFLVILRAFDT